MAPAPPRPGAPLRLGAFRLVEQVGRGGMATVWSGRHDGHDVPVAVKVMSPKASRSEQHLRLFRSEVRAIASVHHPHIVHVFDHGVITAEAARASEGAVIAGSPYLVMEWASGTTLSKQRVTRFSELRAILRDLLGALAHAHARQIVHRDLKPSNVLLCTEADARPGLKLADFGIARRLDDEELTGGVSFAGTPSYMAPEQIRGDSRSQGPWTDLYALGCLIHRLATGRPPFVGSAEEVATAALMEPPPRLEPAFAVPPRFDELTQLLLAKDPAWRLRSAADALAMLDELGEPRGGPSAAARPPADPRGEDEPTSAAGSGADSVTVPSTSRILRRSAPSMDSAPPERPASAPRVTRLPESWREDEPRLPRSFARIDPGLGLYGLRPVPLVGREHERDRLWSTLREVHRERRVAITVIEGPAGHGKTRLAEWLAQRALETGSAEVLRAEHAEHPGPGHGLARMLARALGCHGLEGAEALEAVRSSLTSLGCADPHDWVLALSLAAERLGAEGTVAFGSIGERHEATAKTLGWLAAARPLVVLLDDVQWGGDALAFLLHALSREEHLDKPIMFVCTLRDDLLGQRDDERALLDELMEREAVSRVELGPLPPAAWPALVQGLLGLEAGLASRVGERVAGNPLFAVQLVSDWVQRGVLEPSEHGLSLREGASGELPASLHDVWNERLGRLFAGASESEVLAIELAAVLGQHVAQDEWRAACEEAGVEIPGRLVEMLFDRRFARPEAESSSEGWSFVHGMLRETIERRAKEAGRSERLHRACAAMLRERSDFDSLARYARHLVEAGELEAALEPLARAARYFVRGGDRRRSDSAMEVYGRAMKRLALPEDDPRHGEYWLLRCGHAVEHRRMEEAARWARRAEEQSRLRGWDAVLASALGRQAAVALERGELDESLRLCEEALRCFEVAGPADQRIRCQRTLGRLLLLKGQLDRAEEVLADALHHWRRTDDHSGIGGCLACLGDVYRHQGHTARARQLFEEAEERYVRAGMRVGVAAMREWLAMLARGEGALDEAERLVLEAIDLHRAVDPRSGGLNSTRILGSILLARGEAERARELLGRVADHMSETGWKRLLASVHMALAGCAAELDEEEAWATHFRTTRELLSSAGAVNAEVVAIAELVAERASARGDEARAALASELVSEQLRGMGLRVSSPRPDPQSPSR